MSPETVCWVMLVYLIAGLVKGVVGFGMPMVSLALIAIVLGLKDAIILMLIPSLVTNIWQGLFGGRLASLLLRLWPLLVPLCIAIWFATAVLVGSDGSALTLALGVVLVLYSIISLKTPQVPEPGRHEIWMSPVAGAATGVSMGLTGTFVIPGVLYLQALRLGRDGLVQAMGLGFVVASAAMMIALAGRSALPADMALLSGLAVGPALLGMVMGQRIRARLSEERFRFVFFLALLVLGVWLAVRSSVPALVAAVSP